MKGFWIVSFLLFVTIDLKSQQNYNDFEAVELAKLHYKSGRIDLKAKNPNPNEINSSRHCAKYNRAHAELFDNIKLHLMHNVKDMEPYANYDPNAIKIRMKVFTEAPVGTIIDIQYGKQSDLTYPMSVHSQFQAQTTKQNEWEDLEFKYTHSPKGSLVKPTEINQVNILFSPNSKTSYKFYFDDIIGPELNIAPADSTGKKTKP